MRWTTVPENRNFLNSAEATEIGKSLTGGRYHCRPGPAGPGAGSWAAVWLRSVPVRLRPASWAATAATASREELMVTECPSAGTLSRLLPLDPASCEEEPDTCRQPCCIACISGFCCDC